MEERWHSPSLKVSKSVISVKGIWERRGRLHFSTRSKLADREPAGDKQHPMSLRRQRADRDTEARTCAPAFREILAGSADLRSRAALFSRHIPRLQMAFYAQQNYQRFGRRHSREGGDWKIPPHILSARLRSRECAPALGPICCSGNSSHSEKIDFPHRLPKTVPETNRIA